MDAFQVRMDFQALLKRLNASQQSIEKVLGFADRHVAKASADLWDCILNECGKTNLSSRLNILFLLDFLFTDYSSRYSQKLINDFRRMASKDLLRLIDHVVPHDNLNGVKLNSGVTIQILSSWRLKRLFPQEQIADLLARLQERIADTLHSKGSSSNNGEEAGLPTLSHSEILRRIEEDRERHKRIREKLWVLPPKSFFDAVPDPSTSSSARQQQPRQGEWDRAAKRPRLDPSAVEGSEVNVEDGMEGGPLTHADPLDIQFEELWENTSDLNQDDLDAWREEEDERWWGSEEQIRRREAERLAELNQEREVETERKRIAFEQQEQQRKQASEKDEVMSDGRDREGSQSGPQPTQSHSYQPESATPVESMGPPPVQPRSDYYSREAQQAREAEHAYAPPQSPVHPGAPPGRGGWPPYQQQGPPRPPPAYQRGYQPVQPHSENTGVAPGGYQHQHQHQHQHQQHSSPAASNARWRPRGGHYGQNAPPQAPSYPRRWGADASTR
ncbi:hypothetical protein BCV69DRAFT_98966 [Microstroma glucosiphilum]|uniref:CID domain-containing protein n=1 Tax=Pseudomicrostroma glucosiphilum TaxID=1684307 RepID=A0A316UC80_9BASI|nr:hypothetical protein BCV69DRAFT_98966 [Pseudomicrostroma glucosiphilum]PWN22830.1 hypothetical protein BCV69DRAFT_98966 [Pseudomicrostroma glucosiphilum]